MAAQAQQVLSIIRRPQVETQTGLSRSSIYSLMASGDFPKCVHIGPRAVGWIAAEIDAWLAARIAEREAA